MLPFCDFTKPKMDPVIRLRKTLWHRFSLRLPFQKFASSPRQLQRHPYGISRLPSSADLFRALRVLDSWCQSSNPQSLNAAPKSHSAKQTHLKRTSNAPPNASPSKPISNALQNAPQTPLLPDTKLDSI